MDSSENAVPAQTVFDQKISQAAAAATLGKRLLLEAFHYTSGQRDVESFRFSCFSNLSCGEIGCSDFAWFSLELFLQLDQEGMQK